MDRPHTPARAETFTVAGLALNRRARPDVDPATPLVLLVHGAMDRAASFARVMRRLPEYETVAYDRRGYGSSARLEPTVAGSPGGPTGTIAAHGEDLLTVVNHCLQHSSVPRPRPAAVVIGHSLGGLIALLAATEAPQVIATLGAYESPAPWLDNSFARVGGGTLEVAAEHGNAAGAEHFYRMMIGEETFARLRSSDLEARRSEGDALVAELRSLRDPASAFDLGLVRQPVLIGSGELSPPGMTRNSELLAAALGHSHRYVIGGAAHGAHLSRPEAFAAYVRRCVANTDAGGADG